MTTPAALIAQAMRTAGVVGLGETAQAQDLNDALLLLNQMLASWSRRRWLVYHLQDVAATGLNGPALAVGPGMDFDIPRPDRVEKVFARLLPIGAAGANDYPIELLESYEDYADLSLKDLSSFPSVAFYDSGYPSGTLYVWPAPSSTYEIHILVKVPLTAIANVNSQLVLPPEYEEAIHYNLATRLIAGYALPLRPDLAALAKAALNTLRMANVQVPRAGMAPGLPISWRGGGCGTNGGWGYAGSFSNAGASFLTDSQGQILTDSDGTPITDSSGGY